MKNLCIRTALALLILVAVLATGGCKNDKHGSLIPDSTTSDTNLADTTAADTTTEHVHVYEEKVIAPTCTTPGYTLHICKECGHEYKDNDTPVVPHSFGEWKTIEQATCKQEGKEERECSVCHAKETRTVAKADHLWQVEITPPTKTQRGFTIARCVVCGYESEPKDYTDPTGSLGLKMEKNYLRDADGNIKVDGSGNKLYDGVIIVGIGSCNDAEIVIQPKMNGEMVTAIGELAFANSAIKSVSIPATVKSIGNGAFAGCGSLNQIHIDQGNPAYRVKGEVIYNKAGDTIVSYAPGVLNTTFEISPVIKAVQPGAFAGAAKLTEFKADAEKVKNFKVVDGVLYSGDTVVAFPAGSNKNAIDLGNCAKIADYAFAGAEKLEKVTFGGKILDIAAHAFDGCGKISEVVIPDTVKSVSAFAFANCGKLKTVVLGSGLEKIGEKAFTSVNAAERNLDIFYNGTESDWGEKVDNDSSNLTAMTLFGKIRFFSEDTKAGCWHYDENHNPVIW